MEDRKVYSYFFRHDRWFNGIFHGFILIPLRHLRSEEQNNKICIYGWTFPNWFLHWQLPCRYAFSPSLVKAEIEKSIFLCIGIVAKYYGVLVNFSLGMLFALLAVSYIIFFLKDSSVIRDQRLQREIEEEIQDLELHKKFEGNLNLHTWTQIATSLLYVNHTSKAHVKPDNIP